MHGATQAGAQVASTAITVAGEVLETSIQTFGQCFCSFMDYMREREITKRVITQEREITARLVMQEQAATARMQIWSAAVIAEAEARTEEVRIQASLVLATIEDRKNQRESKLEVIQGFMSAYHRWNAMLSDALASRAGSDALGRTRIVAAAHRTAIAAGERYGERNYLYRRHTLMGHGEPAVSLSSHQGVHMSIGSLIIGGGTLVLAAEIATWCFRSAAQGERQYRRAFVRNERAYRHEVAQRERAERRQIERETRRRLAQEAYDQRGAWLDMLTECMGTVWEMRKQTRSLRSQFQKIVRTNETLIRSSPLTFQQQRSHT